MNKVSSKEFLISNTLAAALFLISIFHPPTQDLAIIAMSVGVAYGVETASVLWVSGVWKKSNQNEIENLSDILKVVSLIIFTYLLLTNNSRVQELVTNGVYFVSFIIYMLVGFISIGSGNKDVSDIGWFEGTMIGLFLLAPLTYVTIVTAYIATLSPSLYVLIGSLLMLIAVVAYLIRIQ